MTDHVYKTVEIIGTSAKGPQAAIENALSRASETIRNIKWFEVVQTRGAVEGASVLHWQVVLKLGFTLDD